MKLRPATIDDLDALLDLERACYPPNQAYSRDEYRYALAVAKAVNLVGEDGGTRAGADVVGFVGAFHHARWRVGHVYTVNVHPSQRGRGIGMALMDACHEALRKLRMTRIVLEVNVENEAAMKLYERAGYSRTQLLKDYYTQYRVNDAWMYERVL